MKGLLTGNTKKSKILHYSVYMNIQCNILRNVVKYIYYLDIYI